MINYKLKSTELKNEFQKMTSEQLSDYKFLAKFIFYRVGLTLDCKQLKIKDPTKLECWNGLGLRQYPEEIAQLLVFLYKNKNDINSYFEIGVSGGGSFFLIDSFLRAVNPDMGKSFGIDNVSVSRHRKKFDNYIKENPDVELVNVDSREFEIIEEYDFCLIDGGHNQVGNDYNMVKDYCKIIAFHDIVSPLAPKVINLWNTFSSPKIEFFNNDIRFPVPIGIGVLNEK